MHGPHSTPSTYNHRVAQAGLLTFRAIERQPIGRKLLELFCAQSGHKDWIALISLLGHVDQYSKLVPGEFQRISALDIIFIFANKGLFA